MKKKLKRLKEKKGSLTGCTVDHDGASRILLVRAAAWLILITTALQHAINCAVGCEAIGRSWNRQQWNVVVETRGAKEASRVAALKS